MHLLSAYLRLNHFWGGFASAAATPITILVPPSRWISRLAPSRMPEDCAILGSCWPGSLLASKTPGMDVVLIAMLPVRATTVPAPGMPPGVPGAGEFCDCAAAGALGEPDAVEPA